MGADALPSWTKVQSSNMSIVALSCQILVPTHKNGEDKIKPFKVNQKEEKLTSLPGNCDKIMI